MDNCSAKIKSFLSCKICNDWLDYDNKLLDCVHTSCTRCLEHLLKTTGKLQCQVCKVITEKPLNDLAPSIYCRKIIDEMPTQIQIKKPSLKSEIEVPYAVVKRSFIARKEEALNLKVGQLVFLVKRNSNGWYSAFCEGKFGSVHENYLKVKIPVPADLPTGIAKESFQVLNLLQFKRGDRIQITQKINNHWVEGSVGDQVGLLSVKYMELNGDAEKLMLMRESEQISPEQKNLPKLLEPNRKNPADHMSIIFSIAHFLSTLYEDATLFQHRYVIDDSFFINSD